MSQEPGIAPLLRCLLVLMTVTAGSSAVLVELMPDLLAFGTSVRHGTAAGDPFDEVMVDVCEIAVAGCVVWLWLATAVVAGDAARGRTSRPRGVPPSWRRLVLAACGVALVGGLAAPAHAGDEARTSPVKGLPLPDRATTATHVSQVFARAASHRDRAGIPSRLVVVHPGDTLWAIARANLPPGAHDDAVALRVREIHQANRSVIGTDPDLIRPDQRLRMPQPTTIREEHR